MTRATHLVGRRSRSCRPVDVGPPPSRSLPTNSGGLWTPCRTPPQLSDGIEVLSDYSGQAVCGATCLGVIDGAGVAALLLLALAEQTGTVHRELLAELLVRRDGWRRDCMGLDELTYWPASTSPAEGFAGARRPRAPRSQPDRTRRSAGELAWPDRRRQDGESPSRPTTSPAARNSPAGRVASRPGHLSRWPADLGQSVKRTHGPDDRLHCPGPPDQPARTARARRVAA